MLLGSAYGKVSLDANGVQAGVNQATASLKTLQQVSMAVGNAMTQAGQAMTIGITLPLIAAGTTGVKMASDLAETRSKVQQIFGDMSKDMLAWSEQANTELGMTRQQALDGASTFALFGQAAGKSGQDLNDFAQANTQLATDFASFYNTSPEDAILAIGAAYRGESEPIRRFNILLNDQTIKAKAMQMALYDGNGTLSQQARIMAVNALITEQGGKALGDFARTSGGLANQTRILNAQFKDSLAMLGERLLPIVLKVVVALNTMLAAFQKLPVPVQDGILMLAGFLAILGPVIMMLGNLLTSITAISMAWPTLVAMFPALSAGLASIVGFISTTAIPAIMALGASLWAALAPILPILAVIALALVAFYVAWETNLFGIRDTIMATVTFVQEMWAGLMAFLSGDTSAGLAKMSAAFGNYIGYFRGNWEKLGKWMQPFTQAFLRGLSILWELYWKGLTFLWQTGVRWVTDYVSQMRNNIITILTFDWGALGSNIITGLINGINSGVSALVDTIKSLGDAIIKAFQSALDTHSPSRKTFRIGADTGTGFSDGLSASLATAATQIPQMLTPMNTAINRSVSSMQKSLAGIMGGLPANIANQGRVFTWSGTVTPAQLAQMQQAQQLMGALGNNYNPGTMSTGASRTYNRTQTVYVSRGVTLKESRNEAQGIFANGLAQLATELE